MNDGYLFIWLSGCNHWRRGERFELPDPLGVCGFQDRRLKPLGHPSSPRMFTIRFPGIVNAGAGCCKGRTCVSAFLGALLVSNIPSFLEFPPYLCD